MLAAIYARYSSERQRTTSVVDQIELCRAHAPRVGCVVVEDVIFTDEERSGAITERPGYTRLMAAARSGRFQAILVESQDRLWRDQGEMHQALRRLRFWRIRVFSINAGTDLTDKTGSLLASVTGWKDEIFLEDLKAKTRRGMVGQVHRGLSAGGGPTGIGARPSIAMTTNL